MSGRHSEETKRKIGLKSKGHPPNSTCFKKGDPPRERTAQWRARISSANSGRSVSDETKNKIREKRKLQVMIPRSEETRRKISERQKGQPRNWASDAHRNFLGAWVRENGSNRVGLTNSADSKRKVSETKRNSLETPRGESHPQARLSESQVREIRGKYKPHVYTRRQLATEYETSVPNIKAILSRRLWAHI